MDVGGDRGVNERSQGEGKAGSGGSGGWNSKATLAEGLLWKLVRGNRDPRDDPAEAAREESMVQVSVEPFPPLGAL